MRFARFAVITAGALAAPSLAATLLTQNRFVESDAVVFDSENTFTDPRMDKSHEPGIVTMEIASFAFSFDYTAQCAVGQESSNVTGDIVDHFTRVEAAASATSPGLASATGRSFLHIAFQVDEPEYWSLGHSFTVYNEETPGASTSVLLLEKDGVVLRSFDTVFGLNWSDAMTLHPGNYTLTLELRANVESDGVTNEGIGVSVGTRFTRYATHCPGDVNGDRQVDFVDLNYILSQYGLQSVPGGIPGDVNDDGAVNFVDLNIVLSNYSAVCPTS